MILVPILSLLGLCVFTHQIFKVSFKFTPPIVTSTLIIILYSAAMLEQLYIATLSFYAIGILCLCGYGFASKQHYMSMIKKYRQEICFLLLFVMLFALYTMNANLYVSDDFTFWGVINQEILLNHGFETQGTKTAIQNIHAHYARGPSIFHYFMQLPDGYSEGKALFAHFFLYLIYMTPLLGCRKWGHSAFIVFTIFTLLTFYTMAIRATYNDGTIALIFSSCFVIYFQTSSKKTVPYLVLPTLIMLPIFKEIGLVLSLIASIFIILKTYEKKQRLSSYLIYIAMLTLPYLILSLWHAYFQQTHDFFGRNTHSLQNLLELFQNFGPAQYAVAIAFLTSLLKFLIKSGSLATYLLLIISTYGVKKYRPDLWHTYIQNLAFFAFGLIAFLLWRLYLYYFTFSLEEAVKSASMARYIGTYFIIFGVISISYIRASFFTSTMTKKEARLFITLGIISLLLFIKTANRIPHNNEHYERYMDLAAVKKAHILIQQGHTPIYNFSSKLSGKEEVIWCYTLNYKLKGHLPKQAFNTCVETVLNGEVETIDENHPHLIKPFYN